MQQESFVLEKSLLCWFAFFFWRFFLIVAPKIVPAEFRRTKRKKGRINEKETKIQLNKKETKIQLNEKETKRQRIKEKGTKIQLNEKETKIQLNERLRYN